MQLRSSQGNVWKLTEECAPPGKIRPVPAERGSLAAFGAAFRDLACGQTPVLPSFWGHLGSIYRLECASFYKFLFLLAFL